MNAAAPNGSHSDPQRPVERPRVGYVLKVYPRLSQTFILNEVLAHRHAGRAVQVFSLRHPKDTVFHREALRTRPAPVYLLHRPAPRDASLQPALGEYPERPPEPDPAQQAEWLALRTKKLGLSHLHAHFATGAAAVARQAARLAGVTYSFTAHARDIFLNSVDRDALAQRIGDAAAVITISEYNARWLGESFRCPPDKIRVVKNGLDLDAFPFRPADSARPIVLGIGRLIEKKGFDTLVESCRRLVDSGQSFECRIVGDGPDEPALEAAVERLGLREHVRLLGALPRNRVIAELRRATVLAAPCRIAADGDRDGVPTVLLEAMALGTPCVSTNVTGIPEVIEDGHTGLRVAGDSPDDLADACRRLIADASLRRRLARNARALVERCHDIRDSSEQLRRIFDEVSRRHSAIARFVKR